MKLVRLLSMGRALTTLRDAPTAYRLRAEARLPKFGSGNNPFAKPPPEPAQAAGTPSGHGSSSSSNRRWSVWLRSWWSGGGRSGVSARSGVAGRPSRIGHESRPAGVQGELSLDRVKVVRNDLVDSDVELVLQDGSVAGARRKNGGIWGRAVAAERTLDRWAARLAGVPPR